MSNTLHVSSPGRRWKSLALGIAVCCLPLLILHRSGPQRPDDSQAGRLGLGAFANPARAESAADIDRMMARMFVEAGADPEVSKAPELWSGREALNRSLALLEEGAARLQQGRGYTATFFRRERIAGELRGEEVVHLKLRRKPFSVYMKWIEGEPGQEALFVQGENDGNLILHPGGWKARLLPAVKLDPRGSLARSESRYPIYEVGLQALAEKIIDFRKEDLTRSEIPSMRLLDGQSCNGRDCYFYVVEYATPAMSPEYRKTLLYIDKELSLPISIRNYTWPDTPGGETRDEETLIEYYVYTDLHIDAPISDIDFDPRNEDYAFRR